eukprot:7974848-Alexandrium_andersonii.AAC.1
MTPIFEEYLGCGLCLYSFLLWWSQYKHSNGGPACSHQAGSQRKESSARKGVAHTEKKAKK